MDKKVGNLQEDISQLIPSLIPNVVSGNANEQMTCSIFNTFIPCVISAKLI